MFNAPQSDINVGWGFFYGIDAVLGSWGSGTLGQSDWTRYSRRRYAPTLSQLLAAPLTITVTAIIGIIVTSAGKDILGKTVWSPIEMLADLQELYHSSPRARAAVFFASLGTVSSQLAVSCPFFFSFFFFFQTSLSPYSLVYPSALSSTSFLGRNFAANADWI